MAKRYSGRALLAAGCLALAAFASLSPAGLVLLLLYLLWGALATATTREPRPAAPYPSTPPSSSPASTQAPVRQSVAIARASAVLWSFSCVCCTALLLLQLLLPLLATAGLLPPGGEEGGGHEGGGRGWGPGSLLWWLLGVQEVTALGTWRLLAVLLPPLLSALASFVEAQRAVAACRTAKVGSSSGSISAGHRPSGAEGHRQPPPPPPPPPQPSPPASQEPVTQPTGRKAGASRPEGGHASTGAYHTSGPGEGASAFTTLAAAGQELGHSPTVGSAGVPAAADDPQRAAAPTSTAAQVQTAPAAGVPIGVSTSDVLAGLLLALVVLLWPAAFNFPWLLAASFALAGWALRWNCPSPGGLPPLLRLGQGYAAVCLLALYFAQLSPPPIGGEGDGQGQGGGPREWPQGVEAVVRALGLYRLHGGTALYDLVPQVLHLAALTALYGAMGFAARAAARRRHHEHDYHHHSPHTAATGDREVARTSAGAGDGSAARQSGDDSQLPRRGRSSLGRGYSRHEHSPEHSHGHQGPVAAAAAAGGGAAGRPLAWAVWLCGHPAASALALTCVSMLGVSLVGGLLLALGMWTLLAPGRYGRRLLRRISSSLALLLLAWGCAVYVLTAVSGSYRALLPPVLHSIGLFMFASPPPVALPLGGLAVTTCLVAGLARNTSSSRSKEPGGSRGRGRSTSGGAGGSGGMAGGRRGRRGDGRVGAGGLEEPLMGGAVAEAGAEGEERVEVVAGAEGTAAEGGRGTWTQAEAVAAGHSGAAGSVMTSTCTALTLSVLTYHALHVLVPLSFVLISAFRVDLLHGAYLLWFLCYCGSTAVRLAPDPRATAVLPRRFAEFIHAAAAGRTAAYDTGSSRYAGLYGTGVTSAAAAAAAGSPLPPLPPLPGAPPMHGVLRLFASGHLLLLYVGVCGQLPGLGFLLPERYADVLRLLGLWRPTLAGDCLPLLGALVLATAHAVVGEALRHAAEAAEAAAAAAEEASAGGARTEEHVADRRHGAAIASGEGSAVRTSVGQLDASRQDAQRGAPVAADRQTIAIASWLHTLGSWLGRAVLSFGSPVLAALSVVLALYDTDVGLLGGGYLALSLPLLLTPPQHSHYVSRLRLSHHRTRSNPHPHLYLSWTSNGPGSSGRAAPIALNWLGPAALGLFACLDLALLYGICMVSYAVPTDPYDMPYWWRLGVELLLGRYPPLQQEGQVAGGGRLLVVLLRPASVLLALQLYRWIFAASAACRWRHKQLQQEEDADGWTQLATQQQQQRTAAAPPPPPPPGAHATTSTGLWSSVPAAAPASASAYVPAPGAPEAAPSWAPMARAAAAAAAACRRLHKQESTAWFLKRLLILNVDAVTAVLVFAVLMTNPGALAVAVLAGAAACTVAGAWRAGASAAKRQAVSPNGDVHEAEQGGVVEGFGDVGSWGAALAARVPSLAPWSWFGSSQHRQQLQEQGIGSGPDGAPTGSGEPGTGTWQRRQGVPASRSARTSVRRPYDGSSPYDGDGGSSSSSEGAGTNAAAGQSGSLPYQPPAGGWTSVPGRAAAAAAGLAARSGTHVGDSGAVRAFYAGCQLLLSLWLLVLYALQLGIVSRWLLQLSQVPDSGSGEAPGEGGGQGVLLWSPAALLAWLGLPLCEPQDPGAAGVQMAAAWRVLLGTAAGAGELFGCRPAPGLRLRLGLMLAALAALALRRKAARWRSQLPAVLCAAAAPGQPCCLFWPPPASRPDAAVLPWLGPRGPLPRALRRALTPATSLVKKMLSRLGHGAYSVLKAMDVPADELVGLQQDQEEHPHSHQERRQAGRPGGDGTLRCEPHGIPAPRPSAPGGTLAPAADVPTPHPLAAGSGSVRYRRSRTGGSPIAAGGNSDADADAAGGGGGGGGVPGGGYPPPQPPGWLLVCRLLVRGGMEAVEGGWCAWGGEVVLLALLLSAFTACSVASVALMAAVGWGMAAGPLAQARFRRSVVLPTLGLLLLYSYAAWVGLPQLLLPLLQPLQHPHDPPGHRPVGPPYPPASELLRLHPTLVAWLGLQGVGPLLVWTLFGTTMLCTRQVSTELDLAPDAAQQVGQTPASEASPNQPPLSPASPAERSRPARQGRSWAVWPSFLRGYMGSGGQQQGQQHGPDDLEAPLLPQGQGPRTGSVPAGESAAAGYAAGGRAEARASDGVGMGAGSLNGFDAEDRERQQQRRRQRERTVGAGGSWGSGGYGGGRTTLFAPVEAWAQSSWGAVDWLRYHMVRHEADLLLVALVALVALQRDLLRAGYLAHCLLLFRRRAELRTPGGAGGALFGRLVGFNFFVLMLEAAFQAPWELLLGPSWALPCSIRPGDSAPAAAPSCTLPRLMGLCQLQPGRGLAGWAMGLLSSVWSTASSLSHHDTLYAAAAGVGAGAGAEAAAVAAGAAGSMFAPWWALLNSPVVADLVVWLLLRLHVRTLRSPLFAKVAALADREQGRRVAALRRRERDELDGAARTALAASHARGVRLRRIAKLKALLLGPGETDSDAWYGGKGDSMGAFRGGGGGEGSGMAGRRGHAGAAGGAAAAGARNTFASLADLLDDESTEPWVHEVDAADGDGEHGGRRVGGSRGAQGQQGRQRLAGGRRAGGLAASRRTATWQDLSMADRHPSLWEGEDTAGYSTGGSGRPGSSHADATHPNARQQYDDSSVARRSPRRTRSFTELQDSTYSSAGDTPTADHEGARGSGTSPAPQPPPTYGSAHDSSAAVQAPAVPVAARHRRHASADLSLLEVVQRGGGRGRPGASGDSEGGARSSGRETGSARDLGLASMLAARGGATAVGSGGFSSRLSRPGAAGGGTAAHGGPEAGAGQGEIQPFGGDDLRHPARRSRPSARDAPSGHPPSARRRLPALLARLYGKYVAPILSIVQLTYARRHDDDSYVCYGAYLAFFLTDMTALSAVLPLSMFLYALLLHRKPRQYWQGALLYFELLLTLQYSFLVMGRCLCAPGAEGEAGGGARGGGGAGGEGSCLWVYGKRDFLFNVQVLGLHSDPLHALPLFIAYLATLTHSYSMDAVYATRSSSSSTDTRTTSSTGHVTGSARREQRVSDAGGGGVAGWRLWRALSPAAVRQQVVAGMKACWRLAGHIGRLYWLVTREHEVAPHWIKLTIADIQPSTVTHPPHSAAPSGGPSTGPAAPAGQVALLQATSPGPSPLPPHVSSSSSGALGPRPPRPPQQPPSAPSLAHVPAPAPTPSPAQLPAAPGTGPKGDGAHMTSGGTGATPAAGGGADVRQGADWSGRLAVMAGETASGGGLSAPQAGSVPDPGAAAAAYGGEAGPSGDPGAQVQPRGLQIQLQHPQQQHRQQRRQFSDAQLVAELQQLLHVVHAHDQEAREYQKQQQERERERRLRADEDEGDGGAASDHSSDDGDANLDDADDASVRQRRSRRHHRHRRHHQRQPDTDGTAATSADPCGAIAAGVSRFRVPTLRLQHEALAPHSAWAGGGGGAGGGGVVRHVLLEVVVPPEPDERGRRASAAPARDAAAMLRAAVAAASRQREAALHVPPFQGRPRAPPTAADTAQAAPGASAGASAPTAEPEVIELRPLGGSRLALGERPDLARDVGAAPADSGNVMGGGEGPPMEGAGPQGAGASGLRHRHGRTGSAASDAAALPPLPPTAPHPASAGPGTATTSPLKPTLHRSSSGRASSASPPPRSVQHSPVLSTRSAAGVPGGRSHRPAPPPLHPSSSAHSLSTARARGHSRSAGNLSTDSGSDADLEYDKPPPVLSVPDPFSVPYIVSIESYSQPPRDLYTATAFLDFLSFIYAAIFYQLVASSARTLYDIADVDRRLPLDYLAALMLLFALMVSERAAYMLGWPAAKAALHVGSQVLLLGWTLRAYWQSAAVEATAAAAAGGGSGDDTAVGDGGVRSHLRVFTLLRCLGFCLGALQLRDGYPPLSSPGPAGGGRHTPFFYRRADWVHQAAYNVFYSLPFLYEIRTLLDWTCISTSLDWYAWLKLEDIRASLFVAACRNRAFRDRRIGDRVPRYSKFLQGFLALAALLLVLWLPPLFFSSGAPTYQVPVLQDVHINVSIAKLAGGADALTIQRYPLFSTGDRRLIYSWSPPYQPPPQPPPPAPDTPPQPPQPPARSPLSPGSSDQPLGHRREGADTWQGGTRSRRALEEHGIPPAAPSPAPPPPDPPPAPQPQLPLPSALSSYDPAQVKAACVAPDSDALWRISPPARRALLDMLQYDQGGSGGGGGWSAYGGGDGDGATAPPVVLEVAWSLSRSVPLSPSRGGQPCSTTAAVPLSLPSRLGLVEVLTGRANSTVLTQLNAADPQSHGSPGLFPLFMRLKGDACSARLGLQPGDAPAATANDLAVAVRHRSSLRTGGGTAHSMRSSWKWGWWGKRWEGVQAGGGEEAEADRWAGAMVGCSMALRTSDEPGTAAVQWWAFECGVVLPPAAPPPPLAGGPGARRGSGTWHVDDTAAAAGQRGRSRVGGAAGQGLGGREEGAGTAAWGGGGELLQQQEEDEPLRDACGGAPGGAAAGLSGPPLVAVLEPVQSGLLGATLSRFGITGLYFTFVFAIGRFLRLSVANLRLRIPTEDLPSTRRLVALCQDIYVARAEGELVLEEDLFRALINVYRSPDLLIELSRKHKQA